MIAFSFLRLQVKPAMRVWGLNQVGDAVELVLDVGEASYLLLGLFQIEAAGPGVGVFRGTGDPSGGGHFCSVAFDFSEILAVLVKRRFYGWKKIRILQSCLGPKWLVFRTTVL